MKLDPIVISLLDTDLYKFNMNQVIFHKHTDAEGEYYFKCRNEGIVFTEEIVNEINEQIRQLAKENVELEGKTKTLKEEADKEKGEADRMQQDVQDTENKIAQIQKEIENLQAQSNELKKEIDTKKQIIQSLKGF